MLPYLNIGYLGHDKVVDDVRHCQCIYGIRSQPYLFFIPICANFSALLNTPPCDALSNLLAKVEIICRYIHQRVSSPPPSSYICYIMLEVVVGHTTLNTSKSRGSMGATSCVSIGLLIITSRLFRLTSINVAHMVCKCDVKLLRHLENVVLHL